MGAGGDKMATNAPGKRPRSRSERRKKRGPFTTVKFGSAVVPIYESRSKGRVRYCFAYYRDGRRLRQFFADLEAAKKEARFVAQRIQSGLQHVTDLKPHERDSYVRAVELLAELDIPLVAAIEDYVQARKLADGESLAAMAADHRRVFKPLARRAKVPDVVEELVAARSQDGASRSYLANLRAVLKRFSTAFPNEILGIKSSEIDVWLRGLGVSISSRNSMLAFVRVLFSFARARNYLPADQVTAAEQVKKTKSNHDAVEIFAPEEMTALLHAAPMHLVPILAIGAFAGIRTAELNRLEWSAVDLDRGIIELRAAQAKTASRRIIPITDNLRAWLEPLPHRGRVVAHAGLHKETTALARALKIRWPRNVLRHSFISYRIAIVKSADQVALEAGNSPAIIFKHYRELTTEEQANDWFGIVPKEGQWDNEFNYDWRTRTVKLPGPSGE